MHGTYLLCEAGERALKLQKGRGVDRQEALPLKDALRDFEQKQLTQQRAPSFNSGNSVSSSARGAGVSSGPSAASEDPDRTRYTRGTSGFARACGVCLGASLAALRAQQMPGKERGGCS